MSRLEAGGGGGERHVLALYCLSRRAVLKFSHVMLVSASAETLDDRSIYMLVRWYHCCVGIASL